MDILKNLHDTGFSFSKRFGQNFITDVNLLRAVVSDAQINCEDFVVEVGAGAGTLTREIAAKAKNVTAFEIDTRLEPVLNETLKDCTNTSVIFSDILKSDLKTAIPVQEYKLVANLPYYITTPVIFHFLADFERCKSLTLMVQKEVAQRLTAKPGSPEYGAITAQIRALGETHYLRTVSRNVFTPVPNVDSAIIRIDISPKEGISDYPLLKRTIAAAFEMRRKTLSNNLIKAFSLNKETATELILSCNFSETIRGEVLDIDGFITLSNKLKAYFNRRI